MSEGAVGGTPSESISQVNEQTENLKSNMFYQTQVLKKINELDDKTTKNTTLKNVMGAIAKQKDQ